MRSLKVGINTESCVVFIESGMTASLVFLNHYFFYVQQRAPSSDFVQLCVAITSWHAVDHINEDLQLERSGRVGPVAARKLTASSSGENGEPVWVWQDCVRVEIVHTVCSDIETQSTCKYISANLDLQINFAIEYKYRATDISSHT